MWYLCVFFHRLLDYRKPEVESLAQLFGVTDSLEWKLPLHHHPDSPFHFVNLPSDDIARKISTRSQPPLSSLSLSVKKYRFFHLGVEKLAERFMFFCGLVVNFVGILVKGIYKLWGEGSSYEELDLLVH